MAILPEQPRRPDSEKTAEQPVRALGLASPLQAKESAQEDSRWWTQFKLGSEQAFSNIFLRYHPILLRYGRSLVQHEIWVDDVVQDLFLDLWQTRSRLGDVESVKYYLVVSLRRRLLRLKKTHKRLSLLLERARFEHNGFESSAEELLIQIERDQALNLRLDSMINELPTSQHRALQYRYIEDKSYNEIAALMSINTRSARKFVYKAIRSLRKAMQ